MGIDDENSVENVDGADDDGGANAPTEILCPECLTPNAESRHFCVKCATPLTAHAAIDPLGRIYAAADTYRKAIAHPTSRIVVVGMWLLFAPAIVSAGILLVSLAGSAYERAGATHDFGEMFLAAVPLLLVLEGMIAVVVLVRMMRRRRALVLGEAPSPPREVTGGFPVVGVAGQETPSPPEPVAAIVPDEDDVDSSLRLDATLVDGAALEMLREQVTELAERERIPFNADLADPAYGTALRNFLLFSEWPFVIQREMDLELDEETVFYNAYYWFRRYAALRAPLGEEARAVLARQEEEVLRKRPAGVSDAALQEIDQRVGSDLAGGRAFGA